MDVYAPNAELVGSIIIQDDSKVTFARQSVADDIAVLKFGGAGAAEVEISRIELVGSGIGVQNVSTGTLFFKGDLIEVENGYGVGDGSSTQGHIHLDIGGIQIIGSGAGGKTGISRVGGGWGHMVGHVGHISEQGAGIGNGIGIRVFSGEVDLEVSLITCNVAYNVSVGGTLRMFVSELTGTEINNGTAHVVKAGRQDADRLQGLDILDVAPTNGHVLTWNTAQSRWEPQVAPGACGEAFTFVASRNLIATDVYLRGPDGTPTNTAGFVLPFDATIFGIGAATAGNETWTAEVRKNDAVGVVASLSIINTNKGYGAASVDVDAGDELQLYCNGTGIDHPTVVVYLRRR